MNKKTYIDFDQYQRYQTIFNIIDFYRKNEPNHIFSILEIGSNEHKDLKLFLPEDNITFTDIYLTDHMKHDPDFQQADGTSLQYQDNSFDFVIAADVLEHVPQEKRAAFCKEIGRVSKYASIICFPYQTTENDDAEERLNAYYKGLYGEDFIWLKEHRECGLPKLEDIDAIYSEMDHSYRRFFHGNLETWEKIWYCHFNTCEAASTTDYRYAIDHYYNVNIYDTDISGPCYRVFYVYCKCFAESIFKYIDNMWKPQNENSNILNFLLNTHLHMVEQNEINHKALGKDSKAATVYWAEEGQVFQESRKYQYMYSTMQNDVRMQIRLKDKVNALRFDPIESPCIVEDLHIYSDQGVLQTIPENAILFHEKYIFWDGDPKFEIVTDGKQITNLDIRAHVTPLVYPEQKELLSIIFHEKKQMEEKQKQLLEQMQTEKERYEEMLLQNKVYYEEEIVQNQQAHEKFISQIKKDYQNTLDEYITFYKQEIENSKKAYEEVVDERKELQSSLDYYILHYNTAIGQRDELKRQLLDMHLAYDTISNAFFWKITSPARHLTDGIKKILHHFKFTSLICKGIRCLHQNGFRYTWRKVIKRWEYRKEAKKSFQTQIISEEELQQQRETRFENKIKFSILTPLYNTPEKFLKEMIESVQAQTYADWELCLADGSDSKHKEVGNIVKCYAKYDKRIKYKKLEKNKGISENTNACLEMADGEYIGLLDHDDVLHPSALFQIMKVICTKNADFIYTDENTFRVTPKDAYCPNFKPDYAPDTLRSYNYICHFTVFSQELLKKLEVAFRSEYDGSQDYDMILRLTEKAKCIVHIPQVLYYWRAHKNSVADKLEVKSYAIEAAKRALQDHLCRVGLVGKVLDSWIPSTYRIEYEIEGNPLISIIIPNQDHLDDLKKCVDSIFQKSTYHNFEILIVENNSKTKEIFEYYDEIQKSHCNIKIITWKSYFNYSAINNYAVQYASGEHYLFVNNDIEVISPDWIQEMLMFAQREDVGAVGSMLYYPDNTIQHAGVILGIGGVAGHSHKYFRRKDYGYMSRLSIAQNLSAVTAACMMVSQKAWDTIKGFDESFEVAFNDVDFCMRIRKAGYLIVWTPYAELYHYESKSRGLEDTPEKQKRFQGEVIRFQEKWKKELGEGDPYYNPNLTLAREDFSLR